MQKRFVWTREVAAGRLLDTEISFYPSERVSSTQPLCSLGPGLLSKLETYHTTAFRNILRPVVTHPNGTTVTPTVCCQCDSPMSSVQG